MMSKLHYDERASEMEEASEGDLLINDLFASLN